MSFDTEIVDNNTELASNAGTEMAISRVAQEVQAAMAIAKRFPRDESAAYARLMKACKRKGLAESARFVFPRGGQKVEGPSIRLAEAAAQAWGNLDFGVVELEQRPGESTVMSYCWDLETNTRQTKIFTVSHYRHTKTGRYLVTDPRDIYEMCANYGARRLRACILGVIPGDVIDDAEAQCERTMAGPSDEPLTDRVRKMVTAFSDKNVTAAMIEKRLGHAIDAIDETELVGLRKIFVSLKDGMSGIDDWFDRSNGQPATDVGGSKAERVAAAMKAKTQPETVDANQAAIARYEAKIAAAADVDTLTTIFESIEQAGLPELAVERLHQLCVERQDALAAVPA